MKLVSQLSHVDYNINIMAIAIIFVKLQQILLINNTLIGTKFANVNKLIQLDNIRDM